MDTELKKQELETVQALLAYVESQEKTLIALREELKGLAEDLAAFAQTVQELGK